MKVAVVVVLLAAVSLSQAALSADEQKAVLDLHNKLRATITATNMETMEWDDSIAAFAQSYSENCKFAHNPSSSYGENLAKGTASAYGAERLTQLWWDEQADYDYDSGCTAGKVCGHYTQMAWANSRKLGCGMTECSGSNILVCNYSPPGNYVGRKPYETGTPCSNCPSDLNKCCNNMCATTECENPSTGAAPHTAAVSFAVVTMVFALVMAVLA